MRKLSFILFCVVFFIQCNTSTNGATKKEIKESKIPRIEKNSETIVKISTSYGDIKIKLYNETPKHRDNFIKLVKKKFYKGNLFHRVIDGFMIQGGDPDSPKAKKGQRLGGGDLGYTIDPEFNNKFFHKKGALAAAREGDRSNPLKKSSASQFYLATGKVYRATELDSMIVSINARRKRGIFMKLKQKNASKFRALKQANEYDEINNLIKQMNHRLDSLAQKAQMIFSPEMIKAYTTIGGTPHLDGNYTVFGEVIEGLEILDLISQEKTDSFDRPLKDIKMKISILN